MFAKYDPNRTNRYLIRLDYPTPYHPVHHEEKNIRCIEKGVTPRLERLLESFAKKYRVDTEGINIRIKRTDG